MKLTPKARAVLAERRQDNRQYALYSRHMREVIWFGSDGDRCYGCQDVPLHPWEWTTLGQECELERLKARDWGSALVPYVRYVASLRHHRRMAE